MENQGFLRLFLFWEVEYTQRVWLILSSFIPLFFPSVHSTFLHSGCGSTLWVGVFCLIKFVPHTYFVRFKAKHNSLILACGSWVFQGNLLMPLAYFCRMTERSFQRKVIFNSMGSSVSVGEFCFLDFRQAYFFGFFWFFFNFHKISSDCGTK